MQSTVHKITYLKDKETKVTVKMSNTQFNEVFEQRHKRIAEEGKKKYEELYQRMVQKLSASHLEPFTKILLEHDGYNFNCQAAIESIKSSLLEQLIDSWNNHFWEPVAAEKLAALEMLKEHFKEYEGKNWNINAKSPEQRVQPLRVHYKEARLNFLKKQVEHQKQLLEKKCKEAHSRRQFLQEVKENCLQINECISEKLSEQNQNKEKALYEEFLKLLYSGDSVFESKPKLKQEF